jgi:hypothetical protein
VAVQRLPLPVPAAASGCPDRAYFPYDQCGSRPAPGGAVLTVDQGFADPLAPGGVKRWLALLTTRDGGQIAVTESNASSQKAVTASRPVPPLTADRLAAIATSRVWAPVLAALPAPPEIPAPPGVPRMTGRQILTVLDGALPPALRRSGLEGWDGYANLTADDGNGKSLITVTVQQWNHDDPYLAPLFKGAERLPDSTEAKTRQTTPDARGGGIEWDVDILRPDGLRVLVTELNTPAFGLPATRQDPPLTLRQLTSLALNPGWR